MTKAMQPPIVVFMDILKIREINKLNQNADGSMDDIAISPVFKRFRLLLIKGIFVSILLLIVGAMLHEEPLLIPLALFIFAGVNTYMKMSKEVKP